ncbi:hypothetical protein N0V83_006851 [Neocucurbitaria cava]|uniref:Uncharacterized protein n=1 Tax=Neocucurbitaria cava TaxID=798079 RepID=A0A9W8Y584_9PLEO|nr:hypothetical protein N0V83_006851 [Neocucurbitaria cava]
MAALRPHGSSLELTHYVSAAADSLPAVAVEIPVTRAPALVASQSKLETLPVEIVNQILSYFTHPRSRLPGLTEAQSAHDFPRQAKSDIKSKEDLTQPPDSDRWAADLFSWHLLSHPFHVLSLTSKRCNELVESYCSHLIRTKPGSVWVLRIDVESLALRLYGTRAFHNAHVQQMGKPCSICAITRFLPSQTRLTKSKSGQKTTRPLASLKKKVTKRSSR